MKLDRIAGVFALAVVLTTSAAAQRDSMSVQEIERLARASQNPVAAMISVPFQLNTSFGTLSPYDRTQNVLNIQPVIPLAINKEWNLITRTIIPVVFQPDYAPSGSTNGLGDINTSLFLSPVHPGKVIWGVGAAFAFPTGSPVTLSAGKFTAGPSVVVLRCLTSRQAYSPAPSDSRVRSRRNPCSRYTSSRCGST